MNGAAGFGGGAGLGEGARRRRLRFLLFSSAWGGAGWTGAWDEEVAAVGGFGSCSEASVAAPADLAALGWLEELGAESRDMSGMRLRSLEAAGAATTRETGGFAWDAGSPSLLM